MDYDLRAFQKGVADLGIELTQGQVDQFIMYFELLIEWNKNINLTAITEFDEVVEKHFLDSIAIVRVMPELSGKRILDLGTGAGFPGIPLKIIFPEAEIVLMDSLNKKVRFLEEVIGKLGLENISAVHGRAEEAAQNVMFREKFDLCVSRAVANLSVLAEYCMPFVKIGGYFVSYKSLSIDQETDSAKLAIKIIGGKLDQIFKFNLSQSEYGRSFVLVKKVKATPKKYPRKAGTPGKIPIGS